MPRPGSQVIPDGWSAHHQPVAVGTMTARCTIDRDGDGPPVWNPITNENDPPARVVLHTNLPCRIQQQNQPQIATTGQQQVSTHDYLVPVPISVVDVELDQQVRIDACDDDPSLVGRRLVITDIQRGSVAWERDLICIDNLG